MQLNPHDGERVMVVDLKTSATTHQTHLFAEGSSLKLRSPQYLSLVLGSSHTLLQPSGWQGYIPPPDQGNVEAKA